MKNTLTKIGLGLLIIFTLAFKANDYRLEMAKENIISDWTWAKDYTLRYIEAMPDDQLNLRPTDSIRTFREQMLHLTTANMGIAAQAFGAAPTIENLRALEKSEGYKTKEDLAEVVAAGYDFVISNLKDANAEKLDQQITLFGQYDMSVRMALHKAFIHQNHHRGQTAIYIRLAGGVPPSMKLF